MTFKKSAEKGFTLIELLVVVAIISLLSSVVLASLNRARAKARDARRISDIHQIQNALELFYNDNNMMYPTSSGGYNPNSAWNSSNDPNGSWNGSAGLANSLNLYMPKLPVDPKQVMATSANDWMPYNNSFGYSYAVCPGRKQYVMVWRPEVSSINSPGVRNCSYFSDGYSYGAGTITIGSPLQ